MEKMVFKVSLTYKSFLMPRLCYHVFHNISVLLGDCCLCIIWYPPQIPLILQDYSECNEQVETSVSKSSTRTHLLQSIFTKHFPMKKGRENSYIADGIPPTDEKPKPIGGGRMEQP